MSGVRFPRRSALRWTPFLMVGALAAGPAARSALSPGSLVVHEWGTFVSMEGSDGLALEGLYHDEEDLPAFVHSRGRDQLRLRATTSKMETPVIYFYTDRPRNVTVQVDFPDGIITQWYPQANLSSPRLLEGDAVPPAKGGYMVWNVGLTPDRSINPARPVIASVGPRTEPGHPWNFARETAAAVVTSNSFDWRLSKQVVENDKFIFYRGLGRFTPTLQVRTAAEGRLTLVNNGREALKHLFLLRVEGGRATYQYLPRLGVRAEIRRQIVMDESAVPMETFIARIGGELAQRLAEQGLFADEARAMVNTWSRSYFRTDGIRVLYAVPRAEIDRILPLHVQTTPHSGVISPPQRVERVFVGRVECLTPELEARVEGWLRDLASREPERAEAARAGLLSLGRFAEPHLQRAIKNSSDPAVRSRAQALLLNDALTELIEAEKTFPKDLDVAARLAALLRRAGQTEEAKVKGEAVLATLQARVPPKQDHVRHRKWLRSMAFAREAAGEPVAATEAYGEWVRFAAGLKARNCQGCHEAIPVQPLTYADLRDWWGGERFREMAIAAGKTEALIAAAETKLKSAPADLASLVTLGYLLPARGDTQAADRAWAKLGVPAAKPE